MNEVNCLSLMGRDGLIEVVKGYFMQNEAIVKLLSFEQAFVH